jgi:ABC-type sugar transport system ATPase subunit
MHVQFHNISKTFVGVTALDDVSLSLERGECHGLMGENGAGKSTLGKVLAGIHRPDAGRMEIDGVERHFLSPADALAAGVGMVHQELAFCPDLTVAENLCMGNYPRRMGLLDRRAMCIKARRLLDEVGGEAIDESGTMRRLTTAQEQVVQIAAAVGTGAKVLVFDEPTSSLSEPEARRLFELIESLKSRGTTIVYVSHRMPEVFRLCDRVSVLRDGKYVGTLDKSGMTPDAVVRMMIGRSVAAFFPKHGESVAGAAAAGAAPRLSVRNLSSPGKFQDISFDVRPGEIVGLAGLVGAGRSEVATAVMGLDPRATGSVAVEGKPMPLGRIGLAKRRGLGLVPEDRKRQGLVLGMSCLQNFSMSMLEQVSRLGLLRLGRERRLGAGELQRLRVKTPTIDTPVGTLSGGNQQKVALAKWLGRGCSVLIVDEPTRGIDIGAKTAIHELLDELAAAGVAVLLISSELPELIALSSRVIVMRDGRLAGELPRAEVNEESLMRRMAGVH